MERDILDDLRDLHKQATTERSHYYVAKCTERSIKEIEELRGGLDAAIRAAKLALFVIRKQDVMPNSSWEAGFNADLATAEAARNAPGEGLRGGQEGKDV